MHHCSLRVSSVFGIRREWSAARMETCSAQHRKRHLDVLVRMCSDSPEPHIDDPNASSDRKKG